MKGTVVHPVPVLARLILLYGRKVMVIRLLVGMVLRLRVVIMLILLVLHSITFSGICLVNCWDKILKEVEQNWVFLRRNWWRRLRWIGGRR
jgi:hypothetical protein